MQIDRAYLAAPNYTEQLLHELERAGQKIVFARDRLIGVCGPAYAAVWAENTWHNPRFLPFTSINQGVKTLKGIQRNWALYPTEEQGRSRLIQEGLPHVSAKPHIFGTPAPTAPLGSWTLWDKHTLLAASHCQSPFVHGQALFAENKVDPPNRAYLKLWEGFTRLGRMPGKGDLCVELGSSPGGWTWVLSALGAHVFSIDRAPLANGLEKNPLVEHCIGSAFAFDPRHAGAVSWLFSDVACYPERLYTLVQNWLTHSPCQNYFCTIKFAGETDFTTLDKFCAIPNSFAMHLSVNKHEVTWVRLAEPIDA